MHRNRVTSRAKHSAFWLGVLLMPIVFWWYSTNLNPAINIPPPPAVPRPNGWDYFLKAATVSVPQPQSFYDETSTPEPTPDPAHADAFTQNYPLASREAWLNQNSEALRLLRQGLKYHCQYPPRAEWKSPYSRTRELGRLLTTESRVHAARGNWNRAAQSALDQIHVGRAIAHNSPLITWLVGSSSINTGVKDLQAVAEGVDITTARDLVRQLDELLKNLPPASDALQEDKWMQWQWFREIFRQPDWRQPFAASYAQNEATALAALAIMDVHKPTWKDTARIRSNYVKVRVRMLSFSKRRIFANYNAVMDAAIATAKRPYDHTKPVRGKDFFSDLLVDVYNSFRWKEAHMRCKIALLETALALRAYRLERGAYPASLQALMPKYLPAVPSDAFNANKPLRYRRDGLTYTLWSVGPDGEDDQGQPSHNMSGKNAGQTFSDSEGDFVYGIDH